MVCTHSTSWLKSGKHLWYFISICFQIPSSWLCSRFFWRFSCSCFFFCLLLNGFFLGILIFVFHLTQLLARNLLFSLHTFTKPLLKKWHCKPLLVYWLVYVSLRETGASIQSRQQDGGRSVICESNRNFFFISKRFWIASLESKHTYGTLSFFAHHS